MLKIESALINCNLSPTDFFNRFSDANNLEEVIVSDKITKWKSDTNSCKFQLNGMATIGFVIGQLDVGRLIELKSSEKSPFPFTLSVNIKNKEDQSQIQLVFEGTPNSFLKMMVKKPLTDFMDDICEKIEQL